jgi:hypothetical protein
MDAPHRGLLSHSPRIAFPIVTEFTMETKDQVANPDHTKTSNTSLDSAALYRIAGFAAFASIVYSALTIAQMIIFGGQPSSVEEAFRLLHTNRIVGLLRLDLPTIMILPLYYLLFLGLYAALRRTSRATALLATTLAFAGNTLVLSTPTALSLIPLSDKYAAATSDVAKSQLLAAGAALMASDIWHGTGAILGAVLLQTGTVLISIAMLRSGAFTRFAAWLGIAMHGLDLAHALVGPFLPTTSAFLLAVAGPFYPVWFFLVGRSLFQLASRKTRRLSNSSMGV